MTEDHQARQAINATNKRMDDIAKVLQKQAEERQKRELEANQRKIIESLSEVQGKLIDRGAAYTNLLLIGGYAGLFAIWSATRAALPVKANIAIAFAITVSLLSFISFEVFKMFVTSARWLKNRRLLTTPLPPDEFFKQLEQLKQVESKVPLTYLRIWLLSVGVSMVSALLAVGLLAYNFFAVLVGWPLWPL